MVERCDFDVQLTSQPDGQTLRPDMRVNLAEGKYVFVDSKVPLGAFLDAAETEDEQQQAAHLGRFARHVRTHVDQLSRQAVLEGSRVPRVRRAVPAQRGVLRRGAGADARPLRVRRRASDVVLATPTTLIGMLRAVSYGWKQAALAETAAEVFRLGRELHERLGQMGNRFDKLGRALRPASTPTTRRSRRSRAGCWSRRAGSATSR